MNYIRITKADTNNGPGVRTVLWVAGCNHHCKECQNPDTWNLSAGQEFTDETMNELIESVSRPTCKGLTFSGGDPLHPLNKDKITSIAKYVRENYPEKSIWCYTGYTYEQIKDLEIIKYLDVLVDGEYVHELRNITQPYCGSENQRVIDVQKTLKSNEIEYFWKLKKSRYS